MKQNAKTLLPGTVVQRSDGAGGYERGTLRKLEYHALNGWQWLIDWENIGQSWERCRYVQGYTLV